MSQLVRLEGKHSTQNAHCALDLGSFDGILGGFETLGTVLG